MNKENVPRPRITIRPSHRGKRRDIRHHNPGTHRRPPTPRVRVLSSITVVPPNLPTTPVAPPSTSTVLEATPVQEQSRPLPYQTPWHTPDSIDRPITNSPWGRNKASTPTPNVDYEDGFRIFPGEAYQPVPRYINRDIKWELKPVDIPVNRRVRFYRHDSRDPRMHDLRVEVTPIDRIPTPDTAGPSKPREHLFQSPRRSLDPSTTSSGPLESLIQLLDQSYGCPRPKPQARPEHRPSTSAPIPPADQSPSPREDRLSESLKELLRIARLFEGPPPDTMAAYRRYKRPSRTHRE